MRVDRLEDELLLCCARVSEEPEHSERLGELLQRNLDWSYLLDTASDHRVTPLLFWRLNAVCPEALPAAILDQLREDFLDNTERNLLLTRELLEIVDLFETEGVPIVAFKGPTLAILAYGNLALREFDDLDVLVREQHVSRARELLISLGYRQRIGLVRKQEEGAFLRSQREYAFVRDDDHESTVELHWAVMPRNFSFSLDHERMWERLDKVSFGGESVSTFSPEDLLLFLCAHGSKHLWYRLAWICDVAKLVSVSEALDWELMVTQASSLGSERMLLLGLFLASDLLGAPLPKEVLRRIQADPKVEILAEQVREWLFIDEPPGIWAKGQPEESGFHPFRLRMRERLRDKARYGINTVLTPTPEDWDFLPLPRPLYPLYYLLRPVRLTGRYGRRLLGRQS